MAQIFQRNSFFPNKLRIFTFLTQYRDVRVVVIDNGPLLGQYIHDFDVDLNISPIVQDEDTEEFLGLGMLGVRGDKTWITRLGVTPASRRRGAGAAIMNAFFKASKDIEAKKTILEVISNNAPAQTMFESNGFKKTRELLVLRRAPIRPPLSPEGEVTWLYRKDALAVLRSYPHPLTWVNALESMENASMFQGFGIKLKDGTRGWLVYRHKKRSITHFVFHTERGNPVKMARNILLYLHLQHHRMDAYAENFSADDPHLSAFFDLGYFEAFRRVEMTKDY